jgi:hypothetical protein
LGFSLLDFEQDVEFAFFDGDSSFKAELLLDCLAVVFEGVDAVLLEEFDEWRLDDDWSAILLGR